METKFQIELEQLINKYSVESESNTPDFILAEYLGNCLNIFNTAIMRRENWYGRNLCRKKVFNAEEEAIMLEKAAYDHNYNNYCARLTLGVLPAITPYDLLDMRTYSASERTAIKEILRNRNVSCDTSRNAYNDWEITLIRMNGCPCGHNGKTVPSDYKSYSIMQVRVCERFYAIGDKVRNDGVIEKFALDCCGRVIATINYKVNCPFRHYTKFIDIVNL